MRYKILVIICSSTLPFIFSLNGDFVFDDSEAITKNKDVISESWKDAFSNDFWGSDIKSNLSHKSYRPLTILTFRINYLISGKNLIAFHFKITNLICHIACCVLILLVYENMMKKLIYNTEEGISFLAAVLFSVHPIHVEAICGIVGRADILSAITFLLSFLLYDKSMNNTKYMYLYLLSSIILGGLAMLFKENGITVLGLCLIYEIMDKSEILPRKTKSTQKQFIHFQINFNSAIRMLIVLAASILLLYSRWLVMGEEKPEFKPTNNPAAFASNLLTKVATYSYIYFLNILLLAWPEWLCYDWSMGCIPLIENVLDYRLLCVLIIFIYGIFHIRAIFNNNNSQNDKKITIMALSLLIIPFLPASNILFPVGFVIAERILYLPSAGFCLLIVIGFNKIMNSVNGHTYKIPKNAFILMILIFSLKCWQRSFDWQTEYNLFLSGISVCPLNAKVRYNVAKVADARQNTDWAESEYKEAIRLYPQYYQAMNNLANLLKNKKQFAEAEYYLREALSIKQDFAAAWMNLGIVLANTKRYNESETAYKTALRYRRNYADCLYNLGNLYLETNNTDAAQKNWLVSVTINPAHVPAWTNLLALLDNTGQTEKAMQMIPKALIQLSNKPSVIFAIANIYGKTGEYKKAEKFFLKAIKLFGAKAQAIHFANLGVLYHRWKKNDLAAQMYQKALEIDPLFKSAKKNLFSLKKQKRIKFD